MRSYGSSSVVICKDEVLVRKLAENELRSFIKRSFLLLSI
jgi:hypothetical protein